MTYFRKEQTTSYLSTPISCLSGIVACTTFQLLPSKRDKSSVWGKQYISVFIQRKNLTLVYMLKKKKKRQGGRRKRREKVTDCEGWLTKAKKINLETSMI